MVAVRAKLFAGIAAMLAACAGLSPGAHAAGPVYQTIDNLADPTFNQLLSINNSGVIAGYFGSGLDAAHPNKGYTVVPPYGQANFTNENFPNSVQTQVTGIDNSGVTVGFWANGVGGTASNFGWVNMNGTFTSVTGPDVPGTGPTVTQLLGVNDNKQAAGFDVDANGAPHGFVYNITTASFTPINVVVNGATVTGVTATGINNSGLVSGFFTESNGNTLGFLENVNGTGLQTFAANGSTTTMFLGLNNIGQEVGTYVDANGVMHGMLFTTATQAVMNLDAPFANAMPGTTTINGLNDTGQYVGFYMDTAGNTHGLLVNSVPEPGSLTLLGIGLAALAVRARSRRNRKTRPAGRP